MKPNSKWGKKIVVGLALLVVAGLLGLITAPADQPLSKDDITLLLLGSSPSSKIIQMVGQRGVDFQMNADLAKKFHDQGAGDDLIDALQKAGNKVAAAKASPPPSAPAPAPAATSGSIAPAATPAAQEPSPAGKPNIPDTSEPVLLGKPNSPDAPEPRAAQPPPATPAERSAPEGTPVPAPPSSSSSSSGSSSSEPVLHTRQARGSEDTTAANTPPPAPASSAPSPAPSMSKGSSSEPVMHQAAPKPDAAEAPTPAIPKNPALKDPDPQEIQHIIQQFAAKEKVFREARNNYTYHQINKVQELGPDDEVKGTYEQEWDILYDDAGKRIEKVTYAPLNTLKSLIVTKEDLEGFRNIQPFVMTTDELPDYEVNYLGHVKVDEITAYVFRIRPKEPLPKNRQFFSGVVYVDDRDLQIVKSDGKQVPQDKVKHGQENLFPRFTTWREQVDGKFWFPTYTMANDTLYFQNGPAVHMKEIVRYTDYKQFKSGARILSVESIDKQKDQTAPAAAPQK